MTRISEKGIEKAVSVFSASFGKGPERMRDAIAAYLDATDAPASDPSPAGWRMVPDEPTPEMLKVGVDARWQSAFRNANNVFEIYGAMLAAAPEPPVSDGMTQAVRDVLDERQRQIAKGWTADHDDGHANSEIINEWFGARERLWKATLKTPPDRQLLVEAAAQVIAEIERVDRIPGQSEIIAARVNGEQKS